MKLNKYIDHTLLKADSTKDQIKVLCEEAKEYDFKSVCINPSWIKEAKEFLKESDVLVCTVIGFPLGAMSTKSKTLEAADAISMGADEVDMVINIGRLKSKDYEYVLNDIKEVRKASEGKCLKVIIETCLLTEEEIDRVCKLALEAGADFVKTSTGFSTGGAKVKDVTLMKHAVEGKIKVKASGGIRDLKTAMEMIDAGAERLGVSAGVAIMKEFISEY